MGFFKDFKRDFAQAVNELMPDKDEMANEYDDEDMVNTFDENDNMDIAPEDMLEDIDDYGDDISEIQETASEEDEVTDGHDLEETEESVEELMEDVEVPEAELIADNEFNDVNNMNQEEIYDNTDDNIESAFEEDLNDETTEILDEDGQTDELKAVDALDEADMLEGTEEAEMVDEASTEEDYSNPFDQYVDLKKDIEEAISKEDIADVESGIDEAEEEEDSEMDVAETDAAETDIEEEEAFEEAEDVGLPEADKFREDVMAEVELSSQNNERTGMEDIFEVDTTYITKNTTINGDIVADGNVDVLGVVNGKVECAGKLIIGGTVKGDIKAGDVYANATKVEGRIEAEGNVKIGVGSIVVGDVVATSAVIAGAVNGDIDVHGSVVVDSTAVIMGNIKSRSVQINNGAVIEGFCSQCYSEIDVKSFFDIDGAKEVAAKKVEANKPKSKNTTAKKADKEV